MNVLILTPDAVGSTLLQRLLTIYMQFHQFDQPVINIHELTNGLSKFYSPDFNREIISSKKNKWKNYQTLEEVVDLLESVDHYKTARLAQYHIVKRGDALSDQLPFYQYVNDNFYIIACKRENLFEHAISQALNTVTRRLNVYSPSEKFFHFYGIYRSGIEIQPQQIQGILTQYKNYLQWSARHFSVSSYFFYETHLKDIEKYILALPVFGAQNQRITWKQTFDQEFEEWNRCHYYNSDIGSIAMNVDAIGLLENCKFSDNKSLAAIQNLLPVAHKNFLEKHRARYYNAVESIIKMQDLGILPSTIPIKKQTLAEKLYLIKNLDQCVQAFNSWAQDHPDITEAIDINSLKQAAEIEYQTMWDPAVISTNAEFQQLSN